MAKVALTAFSTSAKKAGSGTACEDKAGVADEPANPCD